MLLFLGIFFKYDISALKIQIQETHKSYLELLIRIIGIIGGIFATTMLFNSTFESASEFVCAYLCIAPLNSNYSQQKREFLNPSNSKHIEQTNLLLSESNILSSQNVDFPVKLIAAPPVANLEPAKINISFDDVKPH